ncbi:synaptonemal complex protein 2 isoform x8 [Limosa lapponica baueri]|uniref:Synaptonemal complex protein 2 isoform x8 n=1 Tax=Limosa lapponica baueri TaxID=1758121 RepID=A0A2I0TX13_LIMLA|nr:synaptonemal complex protein 2 isoform x8 [Limosa lapponica baueri]
MAARHEMQFEKLIDEATRKKDFQLLEQFLATEDCENISHKCSKQFVNKLDKLLCRAVCDSGPGDYDLQVAITEALCRMISEKQRRELACQWFSMEFVSNAFKGIKDSEFETDCRKFLNQVNGMLGDKRRVFTYPCLSAALDKYEDHQWETVVIPEEEVDLYSLEEKDSKKLLTIDLKSRMNVGSQEGEKLFLYFDSILEIQDVIRKIYGLSKCKGFSKKQSASVAKTTVHVVFDESGSQVLVPESQLSPGLEEKSEEEKLRRVSKTALRSDPTKEEPDVLFRKETANPKQSKTKTKSKEMTDATKSLISKIGDRYKAKTDEKSKARYSFIFTRDDVYNFNISGFDEPTIKLGECVPPSLLSVSSGSKVQSWSEEPCGPIHESGPTVQTFLKRRYHSDTESNSDEVETGKEKKKKGQRIAKIQPRKLFRTDDAVTYRG